MGWAWAEGGAGRLTQVGWVGLGRAWEMLAVTVGLEPAGGEVQVGQVSQGWGQSQGQNEGEIGLWAELTWAGRGCVGRRGSSGYSWGRAGYTWGRAGPGGNWRGTGLDQPGIPLEAGRPIVRPWGLKLLCSS